MVKRVLGFASQKDCEVAIKEIVNRYSVNQEFFDPLLQRLFEEQPYQGPAPGLKFNRFKWTFYEMPNGAVIERWFTAYCAARGWCGVSYNKCLGPKFTIERELKQFARWLTGTITSDHRKNFPRCGHKGCTAFASDVHHKIAMSEIVRAGIARLTKNELLTATLMFDQYSIAPFTLPETHKFTQYIKKRHEEDILVSLCKDHHYAAEGKTKRKSSRIGV